MTHDNDLSILDVSIKADLDDLPVHIQALPRQLEEFVRRLDPSKIRPDSSVDLAIFANHLVLKLHIIPVQERISPLRLMQFDQNFNAGDEPNRGFQQLVREAEYVLSGITTVEYFNRLGDRIKREIYIGLNTEHLEGCLTSVEEWSDFEPQTVTRSQKTVHSYQRDNRQG